ncbi:MAG: insulinase family protein [Candidatus Wallbacteria bacterium]|nr:insulinase family protein [Candidatus Wallbacteria bacterium]
MVSSISAAPPTTAGPAAASSSLGIREATLSNGLRVLIKERHEVPVVSAMVWYRVGSSHEASGDEGLAHYLEHMLFKGTDRYKKGEIDLITMKNGGANNAFTTEDFTAYFFNFASDRWEQALEIEANRMRKCLFLSKEVESERKVVIEELKRAKDSPWGMLADEVTGLAYVVHPYHHPIIGYQQALETVPRDHIFAFYKRHYSPVNATVVIVGDVEPDRTLARVKQLFGRIPRGQKTPPPYLDEPPQAGEKRVTIRDLGEVPRLMIAYRSTRFHTREAVVLDVAGHVLSSGKSSRLYRRLVEDLKLATSVETSNDARRDPGLFQVQVELLAGADIQKAEQAVEEEIRKLASVEVAPAELERARNIASAEFVFEQDTASGLATKIGYFDTLADTRFLDGYLDLVRSVTATELKTTAAKVFVASGKTVGMSLPKVTAGGGGGVKEASDTKGRKAFRGPAPAPPAGLRVAVGAKASGKSKKLDVKRQALDNGLTVLMLENHSLPIVALQAWVRADARYAPKGKEGLAEFTGRMLDEGTAGRTAEQIAEAIENVGGKLDTDSSGVHVLALAKDLDLALDLASDCLTQPAFAEDRVEREKARILSEIRAEQDEPNRVAGNAFRELVYGAHPLHAPRKGYESSVQSITSKDLKAFHASYYRPGNAVLAVVGDFDSASLVPKLAQHFGKWESKPVHLPAMPPMERQKQKLEKFVQMDKEQLNICLGHLGVPRSNPDWYALLVMDYVLGTGPGFTDRISKKLRDEKGLAYTVYANISDSAGEEPGTFMAYIGTSPENRVTAVEGLQQEIRLLREKGCTADELANAKAYLTGNFVFNVETPAQLADFLIDVERFKLGFDYMEKYPSLIEGVTVDDVNRVARTYLDPDAATIVVVGPAPAATPATAAGASEPKPQK